MKPCVFCAVVKGEISADIVLDTEHTLAFLDHRPLFPGHVLVVPRAHHETLPDLPAALVPILFTDVQRVCRAVEAALGAEGTFVAMNNRISQSVPHLHAHVVPRRKGDGMRGFFWPRVKYDSDAHMTETAARLRKALAAEG